MQHSQPRLRCSKAGLEKQSVKGAGVYCGGHRLFVLFRERAEDGVSLTADDSKNRFSSRICFGDAWISASFKGVLESRVLHFECARAHCMRRAECRTGLADFSIVESRFRAKCFDLNC